MKRLFGHIPAKLSAVLICIFLISGGCSAPTNHEGFAIYLTKGDIPPAQLPTLSHVDIAEQPLIAMNDIIMYNSTTHEMTLTAEAFERIASLEVPVQGRSFMVCVDRRLIYSGAFWTPVSSLSYDGVTIWKPFGYRDSEVIKLELGYPSPSFYKGEDPRNNAEVMKSLEQAGKLITGPSSMMLDKLPRSMKGYELYSWQQDNQWHFTLITGTNRNKTLEEITSNAGYTSEDGWVHIHVVGTEAIQTVLGRIPQKESVLWLSSLRSEPASQGTVDISLPETSTIDVIKEHAGQCGLDFWVQTL